MVNELGTAVLTLTADTGPLSKALVDARNKTTNALERAARDARLAGFSLSAALTAPLIGIAAFAVKTELAFQTSFAGVEKSVQGSSSQIQRLRTDILQMSTELPDSAANIADIAAAGGRLGVSVGNLENFTRVAIDLGHATDLSAVQAITGITRLMNIMGTAPNRVREVADTLTYLGNAGASSGTEIINLALRLAATGHLIGLSENDVLGFANGLSSLGLRAEAAGSSFSRLFADINVAVTSGGSKLDKFAEVAGLTREEFSQLAQIQPAQAVLAFIAGLSRLEAEGKNVFTVLAELNLQNIRVRGNLLAAATGVDTLRQSVIDASDATKTASQAEEVAAKVYDTDAAKLSAFAHAVQVGAMQLGTQLLPTLLEVAAIGGPAIQGLITLINDMPGPLRVAIVGAVALGAAIGPISLAVGTLAAALSPALALLRFMALAALNFVGTAPKIAQTAAEIKAAAQASAAAQTFTVPQPAAPTQAMAAEAQAANARRAAANLANLEAQALNAATLAQTRNAAAVSASNAVIDAQEEARFLNRVAMQSELQATNLLTIAKQKQAAVDTLVQQGYRGQNPTLIAAQTEATVANTAAQAANGTAVEARTAANLAAARVQSLSVAATEAQTAADVANTAVKEANVTVEIARGNATRVATGAIAAESAVQGVATATTIGFSLATALAVGNLVLLGATIVGGIILWQQYAKAVKDAKFETEKNALSSRAAQGRIVVNGQRADTPEKLQPAIDDAKSAVSAIESRLAFLRGELDKLPPGLNQSHRKQALQDEISDLANNKLPQAQVLVDGLSDGQNQLAESGENAAKGTSELNTEEQALANTARGTIPWIDGLIDQYDKLDAKQRSAKLGAAIAGQAAAQGGKNPLDVVPALTPEQLAGLSPDEAAQAITDNIRQRNATGLIDIDKARKRAADDYIQTLKEEIAAQEEENRIANTPEGAALRAKKKALEDLLSVTTKLTDEQKDYNSFVEGRTTSRITAEVTDLPGLKSLAKQLKDLEDSPSKSAIADYQKRIGLLDNFWNTVAVPALIAAGEAVDTAARETFEKVATTLLDGKDKVKNAAEGISGYLADLYGRKIQMDLRMTQGLLDMSRTGSVAGRGLGTTVSNEFNIQVKTPEEAAAIIRQSQVDSSNARVPFSANAQGQTP